MIKVLKFFPTLIILALNLQATVFDQKLDFKEGVIHYQLSTSGSQTLYIKEYGKKRVIYTTNRDTFLKGVSKKITYITPKWIYELNLDTNKSTKSANLNYLLSQRFNKLNKEQQHIIEKNLQQKKIVENILGYKCSIESIDGIRLYKVIGMDLILKSEIDILGFHKSIIATDIKKTEIDDKPFKIFENLNIPEDTKKTDKLQKKADKIINSLLNPQKSTEKLAKKRDNFQQIIQDTAKKLDSL